MFIQSQWHSNLSLHKRDSDERFLIHPEEIIEIDEDIMDMEDIDWFVKTYWLKICEDQRMSRFELMDIE